MLNGRCRPAAAQDAGEYGGVCPMRQRNVADIAVKRIKRR